jgi:hypothetical protein
MRVFIAFIFIAFSVQLKAQVFWTEAFGFGCSGGQSAIGFNSGNGAWAVTNTGTNNSSANAWFVSAKERGVGVGVCGAGCAGTNNRTLHIGSTGFFLDLGASYNETGIANATDLRAESPTINCTGKTTITLAFNYIEYGENNLNDNATLWYFDGVIWAQISDPNKTACCGGPCQPGPLQGLWTAYSIALPASANNNANVKIGFRWRNDGDGVGYDPSVAVDDITLSTPVVLPVELTDFSYKLLPHTTLLQWETITEKNTDYFEIYRSEDGFSFTSIGSVKASGNSNNNEKYTFPDVDGSHSISYYKLKIVDTDKSFEYSKIMAVDVVNSSELQNNCFLNVNNELEIDQGNILVNEFENVSIYNIEGKIISDYSLKDYFHDGKILIPIQSLDQGIYLAQLKGPSSLKSYKIFVP